MFQNTESWSYDIFEFLFILGLWIYLYYILFFELIKILNSSILLTSFFKCFGANLNWILTIMQNIHTETKWLWSVREDYTHLQCEASSIAPKVSAAQSSRNGYFPHWNFWQFEKWGKKFAKSIFRVKKFRIWNIIYFSRETEKTTICLGVFLFCEERKKFQVVRHHFSRTLSTTHTKLSMHLGKLICRSNKKSWIRLIFFDPNTVIYIV